MSLTALFFNKEVFASIWEWIFFVDVELFVLLLKNFETEYIL